tara:strand:- start:6222 stop:6695 length:474 start_codon:yes stop_codon:yes gene_type:complete
MNKLAAQEIANHYYLLGHQAAFEKVGLSLEDINEAAAAQRALIRGDAASRIGSTMEQRRREGAIAGTVGGAGIGALLAKAMMSPKINPNLRGAVSPGKALATMLLSTGGGALFGNLLGRSTGAAAGAVDGALGSIPGVRQATDFVSQPIFGEDGFIG